MSLVAPAIRPYTPSIEDALLAETAIRIQLPPHLHARASDRYNAIASYLESHPDLANCTIRVAPQGSMATGTTVAARGDEGFDIDAILHIVAPLEVLGSEPREVLVKLRELLEACHHWKGRTRLRRRCVTIEYADGMHLDITPWVERKPLRFGLVFHHDPERRQSMLVASSPERFAEWLEEQVPDEPGFAHYFAETTLARNSLRFAEAMEVDPVPAQEEAYEKPRAKIALQLMKRNRNLRYAESRFAMPPSILLARLVGETAPYALAGGNLLDETTRIVGHVLGRLDEIDAGVDRDIANPRDYEEPLLDRWPADMATLRHYRATLGDLYVGLVQLPRQTLDEKRRSVKRLFGEAVGEAAVNDVLATYRRNVGGNGFRAAVGGTGAVAFGSTQAAGGLHTARPTQFYGDVQD